MNWRYRNTVLLLSTLAFFATMVARLVISPAVPAITEGFDVSKSAVGFALTGMWMAYSLAQFPSGLLGDRFGERKIILTAVGLTAVASAFLTTSSSFAVFALFVVLLGAGAGLHYSVATSLITKQFDSIGRAIGIHVAGGPLAGLLAPIAAAYVISQYGWRPALFIGTIVALPVFAVFAMYVRPTAAQRPDQRILDRLEFGSLTELITRPSIAYTTALSIIGAFAWQSTASFLPAFLEEFQGYSPTLAGVGFSAYFVSHGLSQPAMGTLSDKYGRDVTVASTMFLGIFAYGLLIVGSSLATMAVAVLLLGVAMSWGAPLQSRYMDHLSEAERGAGFGLVRTVYMILGASGSAIVGTLADVFGWAVSFGVLASLMALGFALVVGNRTLGTDF